MTDNLTWQVTSLEWSQKLKSLGVKRDSLFAYYGNAGIWHNAIVDMAMYRDADAEFREAKLLPAYTVAELGSVLWSKASPDEISKAYGYAFNVPDTQVITPEGLAQCMENPDIGASMLCYLLENKLI